MARSALLNVMVQAVMKAGRGLVRDFGEVQNLQVSVKGPGDFVSAADRRAEKVLVEMLTRARPGYGFLTEETGVIPGTDETHRWIVDPLDGTTNFLHGIPIFAVSLGLERDGEVVAGVIYNPVLDELYVAERGTGAYLNGRRLRVSARRDLATSVIAGGLGKLSTDARVRFVRENTFAIAEAAGMRVNGSAASDLAWVAAGRLDGYWQHGLSPWDMAAGLIIVAEAGGLVSDASGRQKMLETGSVIAGTEAIHRRIVEAVRKAGTTAPAAE